MSEDNDTEIKRALWEQRVDRDIVDIRADIQKTRKEAAARWAAVYGIGKKIGMVVGLFLVSFWAKAKDLI